MRRNPGLARRQPPARRGQESGERPQGGQGGGVPYLEARNLGGSTCPSPAFINLVEVAKENRSFGLGEAQYA